MLPQREDCEHSPVCKFDDQLCPRECGHFADKNETIDAASELNGVLSLLPLDEEKLKTVIRQIIKEEQWEGGTLIEYEAIAAGIRKFHKWLCEQTEAKR